MRRLPPTAVLTAFAACASAQPPVRQPESTRPFPQLVRRFYSAADGLPSGPVSAVAVTRAGVVLSVVGGRPLRLMGDRLHGDAGPRGISALCAPAAGPLAVAGAKDGVWALSDKGWARMEGSPKGAAALAGLPDGTLYALAPDGLWRHARAWERIDPPDDELTQVRALCALAPGELYAAAPNGLFGSMGKRIYWLRVEVRPGAMPAQDARDVARLPGGHLAVATPRGLVVTNTRRGWLHLDGDDGLPVLDLHRLAAGPEGTLWIGTPRGLIRWTGGRFTYLAGERWLPDDRVTSLAAAPDGSAWVGTPGGIAHVHAQTLTLAEKAERYQKDLESRNRRHGYVTVMDLPAPGRFQGAIQEVSDNDGLWTGLYVASQACRYFVTRSPEARQQAIRSMDALLRLETITGIPGFPARAICHESEPQFQKRSLRSDSEWHPSRVEPGWWWKGETSSDELDGHFFAWHVFHELVDDEAARSRVRAVVKRVMDHILDNGYHLVDQDGRPTTWGVWAPEKLNDDPRWWEERGLASLEILSHLRVAHRIVGDARYEKALRELIDRHHYALNAVHARIPGAVAHDAQLAFLSFYPLLRLEKDPGLRALYITGMRRLWEAHRREQNPVWNFLFGAATGEDCDAEAAIRSLREMPLDLVGWKMANSHRADLRFEGGRSRLGEKLLAAPLPWTERPMHKWDKSPFLLDGGSGLYEEDQTLWLLPYWLGRRHGFID